VDVGVVHLIISASVPAWCNFTGTFLQQIFVAIADKLNTRGQLVIPAFTFAFILALTFAAAIRLEAILGAFAAGLVLDETDMQRAAKAGHSIADLLVPIFL